MISFLRAICALSFGLMLAGHSAMSAHAERPQRVVSMNLCTDQLAMLIARPGQLHSVSYLASDENASVLADEAEAYILNHGRAEEIFLMRPDLVIAGTYTTRATVEMLRRLGFRVEEFAPASSFADIRKNLRRMGVLLGRRDAAQRLITQLDANLSQHSREPERRPLAAVYYANSYTSGGGTLADEALEKAGLDNLANRLGYSGTARLPLEVLVKETPDIVIGGQRFAAARGRAHDNLLHPALEAVTQGHAPLSVPDKYWICGTPFTAEAVRILANIAAEASE
jgi:iron complex transport system substrate-binding protein